MEYMDKALMAISAVYTIMAMSGTGYILFRFAMPFMENKRGA